MAANALLIDYEYCDGCHTCEVACAKALELPKGQKGVALFQDGPRQLPNGKWELNYFPMPTSLCDLCATRIAEGKDPSCVHHCPCHALKYGTIEEMAKEMAVKKNRCMFVPGGVK